jgi:hypothetical protein
VRNIKILFLTVLISLSTKLVYGSWDVITGGMCKVQEEGILLKKGTKVRMYSKGSTERGKIKIIVEDTVLKKDRMGRLINCENGIFIQLYDCGNLIVLSEKKVITEKVIVVEKPIEKYVERPVYVPVPPPPPPPVIYAPPPPPPIPRLNFYFHYERHKIKAHIPSSSYTRPPMVVTRPPYLH